MFSDSRLEPIRVPVQDIDEFTANFHYKTDSGADSFKSLHVIDKLRSVPMCMIILEYFKALVNYPSVTVFNKLFFANQLLAYLGESYDSKDQIPNNVISLFLHSINSTYTKPASMRQVCSSIRTILNWGTEQDKFTKLSEADRRSYLAILKAVPSVPIHTESDATRLALSQLIEGYDVDDLVLLDSLNHFCWHFLRILQRHREVIKADSAVWKILENISATDGVSVDAAAWKSMGSDLSIYRTIFDAVANCKDLSLQERLLFNCRQYREDLIQSYRLSRPMELQESLSKCTWKDGSLRQFSESATSKLNAAFFDMDFRHLIAPVPAEEVCLRWIMAADRIQHAGQQKIELSDILITPTHCTIAYEKKRAGKAIKCSTAYRRKSWQYKIYEYYTALRNDTNFWFPNDANDSFWFHKSPFNQPQNIGSQTYRLLLLSILPFSHIHQEIVTAEPKAKPFINLLIKVMNKGTRHPKLPLIPDVNEADEEVETVREGVALKISPGAIAQSRAIVDDDDVPSNTPYDRYAKELVNADSAGHSASTSEFVYKARSETVHRKAKRSSFSKAVNELQEKDARKLLLMLEETECLSLRQMKEFLGWSTGHFSDTHISEFNELIKAAEAKGYNCTPFGALFDSDSDKKIIIKSPITVALMLSYKETCEEAAENAANDEQALALALQSSYISVMLEQFESKVMKDGKDLHVSHAFPKAMI
ncbi:hypothetical protein [Pseudomonas sp. PLMAX]|uniref:hypothetical protein n=1 Tax=Pseudomonas sp. PLMAX TaxID=2201998 RepID=UPI0038BCFD3E